MKDLRDLKDLTPKTHSASVLTCGRGEAVSSLFLGSHLKTSCQLSNVFCPRTFKFEHVFIFENTGCRTLMVWDLYQGARGIPIFDPPLVSTQESNRGGCLQ